jgi:hypothetical protein
MHLSREREAVRSENPGNPLDLTHHRGLPLGYINHLEQRLAETESALYGALTTLRSLGQPTTPVSAKETTPKQKAARMEEWSGLPLRDAKDMQHWLCIMSDRFSIEPAGPGNAPIAIPIPETPANHTLDEPQSGYWRDGRVTESPFETHPTGTIALPYFGMNEVIPDSGLTDDAVGVSGDANSVDRSTRAEELSHKNPNLYF